MIIDTHVHIWDKSRSPYNWLHAANELLNRNYTLHELEADRLKAGIDAGLLVQADNTLQDTALMLEAARQHEWIKGVVAWLPLMQPEKTWDLLQTIYPQEKYIKGIRHLIHDEPDVKWLLQEPVIESLKLLAAHDLPFDIVGVKDDHIQTALEVAEKVPELKMIFDHMIQPPIQAGQGFGEWGRLMKMAARHPRFYIKISGLGTVAGKDNFTADTIQPYIEYVLQEFGIRRCCMGSDWPVSITAMDYVKTWDVYKSALQALLKPDDLAHLYCNNAIRFYNLEDL